MAGGAGPDPDGLTPGLLGKAAVWGVDRLAGAGFRFLIRRLGLRSYAPAHGGPEVHQRITARRAELDELEEQLVKQLSQVRAERDELAVAVRVWQRMIEQLADERATAGSPVVQVAGRAVRLVPDRARSWSARGRATAERTNLKPRHLALTS